MSTAQWGVISIGYDELAGASTPSFVRSIMKANWLVYDQSQTATANSYSTTGGDIKYAACYALPASGLCDHSDTGGWLTSMAFVGNANNAAAQNGMSWLNKYWKDPAYSWYGLFVPASACSTPSTWGCAPYAYSMWAVYKGLESNIGLGDNSTITTHLSDCGLAAGKMPGSASPSGGVCNWWEDQNEVLVRTQNASGSWTDYFGDWPDPLSTALFVNILGAVPLPASITQGGSTPPLSVPALSAFGLVALGIMLAAFAAMRLRKPRPGQS
jgi:hypothetical protein